MNHHSNTAVYSSIIKAGLTCGRCGAPGYLRAACLLQAKAAEVKETLVDNRGSAGSSGSGDFPSALWRVSVSRLFLYPRTLPPPPPRVPARRFLGAPFDKDSPIKVIKRRVPGSSSPGTCRVLGPPPPSPFCRSRVFLLLLRHDSTAHRCQPDPVRTDHQGWSCGENCRVCFSVTETVTEVAYLLP